VAKKPKGKDDSLNRLSKELQELAEPFGGWLSGHAAELPTPVTFADLEGPLLVGVGLMQRLNGAALTGWRPVQLAEALKDLAGHADLTPIVGALLLHTRFLADTGRWGGNPDDVTMSIKLLQAELLPDEDENEASVEAAELAPLDPAVEAARLEELPVVARLRGVLDWIDEGRALTSSGALKRADIGPVAVLLGDPNAGSRSMWDSPTVSVGWVALHNGDLVEATGSTIRPTALASTLSESDPVVRLPALRQLVNGFVLAMLDLRPAGRDEVKDLVVQPVVTGLAQAVAGGPVTAEQMAQVVAGLHAHHPIADVDAQRLVDAELAVWADSGLLVDIDGHLDVPVAAQAAVAAALVTWSASTDGAGES
jgi:hypothetical protein